MARGLSLLLILTGAMLALAAPAARGESTANHGVTLSGPPAPSGPYEQNPIRRSGPAAAPTTQGRGASSGASAAWEMAKMPVALLGIILLIFGMRAVGRKMLPGAAAKGTSRAVQVLVRSAVSPRQQIMLIQVGRRLVLVGSGGAEMNPLCQIDDPDEVAEVLGQIRQDKSSSVAKNFRTLFGKAGKAYEEEDVTEERDEPRSAEVPRVELSGLTERVRRIAEQFGEA